MPEPVPDQDSTPYWAALAAGRLSIQRCRRCGHAVFYPRARCPACHSDALDWEDRSGRGTVYSFSVVHREADPSLDLGLPYVVAIVDLEEGGRLMTNIVDCDPGDVTIGMPVQLQVRLVSPTISLPVFGPAGVRA